MSASQCRYCGTPTLYLDCAACTANPLTQICTSCDTSQPLINFRWLIRPRRPPIRHDICETCLSQIQMLRTLLLTMQQEQMLSALGNFANITSQVTISAAEISKAFQALNLAMPPKLKPTPPKPKPKP